jgi:hypothetical protein
MPHYLDPFLHHPDGTHRSTPESTDGRVLEHFETSLRRHRADGHTHAVAPYCGTCHGPSRHGGQPHPAPSETDKPLTILDAPPGLGLWEAAAWLAAHEGEGPEAARRVVLRAGLETATGQVEPREGEHPLGALARHRRMQARLLRDLADQIDQEARGWGDLAARQVAEDLDRQEPTVQHVDPLTGRRTPA